MPGTGPRRYPPPEQLQLLSEEISDRTEAQTAEIEGLDRKASTALAATAVVLGLVANNVEKFSSALSGPRNVFYFALVLLALGLVTGVLSIRPRKAKVVPAPRGLIEGYYAKEHEETLAVLISTRLRAFEDNKNISRDKVRWLRAEMFLLAAGGAALVAAFVGKEIFK